MLTTVRDDIQKFWRNGLRPLLIAFVAFLIVSVISIGLTITAFILTQQRSFSPLRNEVPQITITTVVPVGGVVVVEGTKCNDENEAFATTGETNVRNIENGDLYLLRKGEGVRSPGCQTRVYENQLSPDIPPGHYRMEGFDLAVSDHGDVQREPHYSEPFEIVEAP